MNLELEDLILFNQIVTTLTERVIADAAALSFNLAIAYSTESSIDVISLCRIVNVVNFSPIYDRLL